MSLKFNPFTGTFDYFESAPDTSGLQPYTGGTSDLDVGAHKVTAQQHVSGVNTLTSSTAITIDCSYAVHTLAIAHNTTFSTSNLTAGTTVRVRVVKGFGTQTVAFPAWKWIGEQAPTSISTTTRVLSLFIFGTTDADVVAIWEAPIIPISTNPTVDANSPKGYDTTAGQFLVFDGSAVIVVASKLKSFTFLMDQPTGGDMKCMFQAPTPGGGGTLLSVMASNVGGTSVTFQIQKRSNVNSAGTNMLSSSLTSSQSGGSTTSFSTATFSSTDHLCYISSSISGTVDQLVIRVTYIVTRE